MRELMDGVITVGWEWLLLRVVGEERGLEDKDGREKER